MPKKSLGTLTESMFYVLLSMRGMSSLCGTEIAARIREIGGGTVEIGPATLYTVLGKFREAGYIEELSDGINSTKLVYEVSILKRNNVSLCNLPTSVYRLGAGNDGKPCFQLSTPVIILFRMLP